MQATFSIAFPLALWYHEPCRGFASRPKSLHNVCVEDDVLKELETHAAAVLKAEAVAEEHREAIRRLLPQARKAGHGPAKLERTIKSVYVRDTISRWTKAQAQPRGKRATASES